ncbi:SgcJ/EcaC family oxidoreductase [Phenylobacterium sp.]|uniref:SgcJ/EcaC family oxidoreductase n=1 Tax=Phenylobacterium sp. TaxID=1871053 RepID=UPI003564FB9A
MSFAPRLGLAVLALAAAVDPVAGAPALPAAVEALQHGYVEAWDRADPAAIAAFFARDGDFTNPTGFHAQGRADIAAFYGQAFAAGYAGSRGGLKLLRTRMVAPGVMVVDGEWSIRGAHTPKGAERPGEQGLATAVLVRTGHTWRIAALREQEAPAD